MFLLNVSKAQTGCGTGTNYPDKVPSYNSGPIETNDISPICVRVFFHIVRNTAGTNGFQAGNIPLIVNRLNQAYNPNNILIRNEGFDFINNDLYGAVLFDDTYFDNLVQTQNVSNAINIYLLPVNSNIYAGKANGIPGNAFVVGFDFIQTSTLPHELGHCLNLFHTHHQVEQGGCTDNGTNCNSCGDFVCDTPIDPVLSCGGNVDPNTCVYTGGGGLNPDTRNIMSYSCRLQCRNRFTIGQGNRMGISLLNDPILKNFATTECMRILGSAFLCANNNNIYSVENAPTGSSYVWTLSNNYVCQVIGTNTNPTVTLGRLNDGYVTLTCQLNIQGGATLTITKDIYAGNPQISGSEYNYNNNSYPLSIDWGNGISNNTCYLQNTRANVYFSGNSNISWQLVSSTPSNLPPNWSQQGNSLQFYFWTSAAQSARFKVTGYNGCGNISYFVNFTNINCGPNGNPCNSLFNISPNPSNGLITIITNRPAPCNFQLNNIGKQNNKIAIKNIKIIDQAGAAKGDIILPNNKSLTNNITLPSNLTNGTYVLEIYYNYGVERKTIIVNK